MQITFKQNGDLLKTEKFLTKARRVDVRNALNVCGQQGVKALSQYTPKDTGLTANSWDYEVTINSGSCSVNWINNNVVNGMNIAILIQYGHGTGNGGYVEGFDYINPALEPVFKELAENLWKEVNS